MSNVCQNQKRGLGGVIESKQFLGYMDGGWIEDAITEIKFQLGQFLFRLAKI